MEFGRNLSKPACAGRIGKFAKSNGREDPKEDLEDNAERNLRGLHFKDIYMFAMFNKEKRKTELYIRLTKDKKGKGDNPQNRGHCTFYKDLKAPLYQNNFLFSLSMLLTRMPKGPELAGAAGQLDEPGAVGRGLR